MLFYGINRNIQTLGHFFVGKLVLAAEQENCAALGRQFLDLALQQSFQLLKLQQAAVFPRVSRHVLHKGLLFFQLRQLLPVKIVHPVTQCYEQVIFQLRILVQARQLPVQGDE